MRLQMPDVAGGAFVVRRRRLAVFGAIALCGGAFCTAFPGKTESASVAAVRVAPTGNDNCSRSASSTPCLSFSRAYAIARPGDVVSVAAGTYAAQRIVRGSQAQTGPVITFRCVTAHACVLGGLYLGQNNGSLSGDAPSYLTFDGIDVHDQIWSAYNQNADPQPTHLTFEHGHVWSITSAGTGMLLNSVDKLTVQDFEIGPICCGGGGVGDDGMEIAVNRPGAPSPSNVALNRVYIHDLYDSCNHIPAAITSRYGSCSGTGYGDGCGSCDHVDGIQVYGARGFLLENSRLYAINPGFQVGQGLFMQEANGGSFSNVTIENSMFAATPNNTVSMSGPGNGSWSGYVHVYYNTIQGNLRLYGDNSGSKIFVPGTSIVVAGNITGNLASSNGNSCSIIVADGSSYTPTYTHNLNGNQACSSTDRRGAATFVDGTASAPDLRLRPGSRGLGDGSIDVHPRQDIAGRWRPVRLPPDLGAAQLETALVVPGAAIGGARLGMDAAAITELYGHPRRLQKAVPPLASVGSYRVHGGWLYVGYDPGGHVVRLTTTSRYYSTAAGIGPGSDLAVGRMRKQGCPRGKDGLLLQGTKIELQARVGATNARITGISVARPRYALCRLAGSP